jgi:hypothetical protein
MSDAVKGGEIFAQLYAIYNFDPEWSKLNTPVFYKLGEDIKNAKQSNQKIDWIIAGAPTREQFIQYVAAGAGGGPATVDWEVDEGIAGSFSQKDSGGRRSGPFPSLPSEVKPNAQAPTGDKQATKAEKVLGSKQSRMGAGNERENEGGNETGESLGINERAEGRQDSGDEQEGGRHNQSFARRVLAAARKFEFSTPAEWKQHSEKLSVFDGYSTKAV